MFADQALEFRSSSVKDNMRTFFTGIWFVEAVIDDSCQLRFTLDLSKVVQNYPFLKDANFRLKHLLFINSREPKRRKSKKLLREQQAVKYRKLLEFGKVKNRAELARKFGVSRACVMKV